MDNFFVFQECLPVRAGEGVAVWAGELMHSGHNPSNRLYIKNVHESPAR